MVTMKMNKKVILIIALCIGIASSVFGLIYIINNPRISTEELVLYNYTFQPGLSYEVHLIENNLYDNRIQEEGAIYIKNILDYINIDLGINYQASDIIPLDMEYTMNASVVGYSSGNGGRIDYWSKDFPLSDRKTLHMESNNLQEVESLKIKLDTYEDFAEEANKLTGVNLSSELIIGMVGYITATTSDGVKETPFDINMTIPLQENLIEITKGNMQSSTEKFTKSIDHTMPLDIKYIVFICIIIALLVIGLLCSIFLIYEPLMGEILRGEVKKIVKNYGSRMVALQHSPNKTFEHLYEVASIKDLLILSDEMHKPIYYITDAEEFVKNCVFHVENKGDLYTYKHNTSYNNRLYYNESIEMNDLVDVQKEDVNKSNGYQIPNS